MAADRGSLEACLRSARARRARLAEIVNAPALLADARCGDADARRQLDDAAGELQAIEHQVADLEAQLAGATRGAAA